MSKQLLHLCFLIAPIIMLSANCRDDGGEGETDKDGNTSGDADADVDTDVDSDSDTDRDSDSDTDRDLDPNDPFAEARLTCVDRINEYRNSIGLPPYARWTAAEECADSQAERDSISNDAHGAFGDCNEWAQNECPGWGSIDQVLTGCLKMMWDEGPGEDFDTHGHYINMSSTDYDRVACGFFITQGGDVWAVQNFR